jgi:high affinity Mn2+ porin
MRVCTTFTHRGEDGCWMLPFLSFYKRPVALAGLAAALIFGFAGNAAGQATDEVPEAPAPASTSASAQAAPVMFPHPDNTRYFVAGQANIIFQAHAPFHSPYAGTNSLLGRGEYKTSMVGTLYLAYQLNPNPKYATDGIFDAEIADGRGISEALGVAGMTNLDVVRNPNLGKLPYLGRYELHQVIGLSDTMVEADRGPFSLSTSLPLRRIELHVGRMGLPDYLDLNSVGTDSHLQFLNWSVDNNGAWDYAANTRGYTDGVVAEYIQPAFAARYAIAAMPVVANGQDLQYEFRRASGQNVELELHRGPAFFVKPLAHRSGAVRLLGYVNHANMGDYRQQNIKFLEGLTPTPDITAHPLQSTVKYGVGLNMEQIVSDNLRLYGRFGWNEGQHESYAYTEIDQTFAVGADYAGRRWNRPNDKVGLTVVTNAIKRDHQAYLKLGGLGFLLGDGNLNYAREDIVEGYYNVHTWRGVFYALDAQYIAHPGYNQDRGPVLVESVRMHVDF